MPDLLRILLIFVVQNHKKVCVAHKEVNYE